MRKQLLTMATVALASVAITPDVLAQNSALALIGGARFGVTSPSSLAGSRVTTFGSTDSDWGVNFTNPIINVPVVQALGNGGGNTDSLLCTPVANGTGSIPSLTGNVAIFYRGSCDFSAKALQAQIGGAVGAIIINNIPGPAVGMAGGTVGPQVTIPVFMLSDVDGAALIAAMRSGSNVSVSMSQWGLGYANDIGIVPNSSAAAHGGALPLNQLGSNNGNPAAYRMFNGSIVANFGTATQTNIKTVTTIDWVPNGGSATRVWSDTGTRASLAPSDSVRDIFSTNYFNPHATSKGKFTLNSTVVSTTGDATSQDNLESRSVFLTDSIYCKGTWDSAANHPRYQNAWRYSNQSLPLTWGPLFYTAKGGQYPAKLQFSLTLGTTAPTLSGISATTCVFKWKDGSAGAPKDGVIQEAELKIQGVGFKTFTTADSNFRDLIVPFDPNSLPSQSILPLEDSSWYYYTVTPSSTDVYYVADANDFSRVYISNKVDPNNRQYPSPQYTGDINSVIFGGSGGGTFQMVSGYRDPNISIDSLDIAYPIKNFNVAAHVSNTAPVKVDVLTPALDKFNLFPNPASDVLNIEYSFNKNVGSSVITIFDGMGRAVNVSSLTSQSGTLSLDLNGLSSGNYWLVLGNTLGSKAFQFHIAK